MENIQHIYRRLILAFLILFSANAHGLESWIREYVLTGNMRSDCPIEAKSLCDLANAAPRDAVADELATRADFMSKLFRLANKRTVTRSPAELARIRATIAIKKKSTQ